MMTTAFRTDFSFPSAEPFIPAPFSQKFSVLGSALLLGGAAAAHAVGLGRVLPKIVVATGAALFARDLLSHQRISEQPKWRFWSKIAGVIALSIALFQIAKSHGCEASDNFRLADADPNREMTTYFNNPDEILKAKAINDLSIEVIQNRARNWSRFIGHNENLKDVILQDWKTVNQMGTSPIELARHLQLIANATPEDNQCPVGLDLKQSGNFILYDPARMENSSIGAASKTQLLYSCWKHSLGFQADIFQPKNSVDPDFTETAWASELVVMNPVNGVLIRVGTNPNHEGTNSKRLGVIDYIQKYGFFEGGGSENPYRVDPVNLGALLTGMMPSTIKNALGQA